MRRFFKIKSWNNVYIIIVTMIVRRVLHVGCLHCFFSPLGKSSTRESSETAFACAMDGLSQMFPDTVPCGKKNDIDHALSCKSGPYVNFRHNAIRDAYAEILKEVCVDVRTEPGLLPVNPANLSSSAITTDQARLDIVATGLWSPFERTFFDVRVTHPLLPQT